jgi:hypothetical protein
MPPATFDPATPASERPQTHTLDRVGTETGDYDNVNNNNTDIIILLLLLLSSSSQERQCFENAST